VQPDTIVPDTYDPLAYDRYSYVANNPVKHVDPSGHCWEIASGIRGLPSYDTTCNNLDMALTIVQSDQANLGDKVVAGAYITGEVVAHGTAAVYGGLLICGAASAACYEALTAGPGILEAACRNGRCPDLLNAAAKNTNSQSRLNTLKGLTGNGPGYEEWIVKNIGGEGSFKLQGTQFDNKLGNVLMEAKSYSWENMTQSSKMFSEFQNQIGRGYSIATQNGYSYLLRMLNQPPQYVIDWLEKKGIPYIVETSQ
jgi:hypothetical protein